MEIRQSSLLIGQEQFLMRCTTVLLSALYYFSAAVQSFKESVLNGLSTRLLSVHLPCVQSFKWIPQETVSRSSHMTRRDPSTISLKKYKARFKRRTFHVPNLIIRFGTWKVRRMNQLSSTDLYLGRPAVLFDRACRIERQKIDFNSYVDLSMCRI